MEWRASRPKGEYNHPCSHYWMAAQITISTPSIAPTKPLASFPNAIFNGTLKIKPHQFCSQFFGPKPPSLLVLSNGSPNHHNWATLVQFYFFCSTPSWPTHIIEWQPKPAPHHPHHLPHPQYCPLLPFLMVHLGPYHISQVSGFWAIKRTLL